MGGRSGRSRSRSAQRRRRRRSVVRGLAEVSSTEGLVVLVVVSGQVSAGEGVVSKD